MGHLYRFGPFLVDSSKRVLSRDGAPVPLTPKAFDLLLYLAQNPNRVVTKEELLQNVWSGAFVEEGNLTQNVFLLRKALAEGPGDSGMIVTIPRKGYQLAADVATETEDSLAASRPGVMVLEGVQSTTHIVIEEEVDDSDSAVLSSHGQKALPAPPDRPHWKRILAWVFAGAIVGALAFWIVFRPVPVPKVIRTVQITSSGRVEPFGRSLSDGSRVFFAERIGATWDLEQVPERGGEAVRIPISVANVALCDMDRQRSRMLVVSQGPSADLLDPLWAISTSGGSGRRIGDVLAGDAAWSPDGQRIAYANGSDLFVVGDDGQHSQKLLSAPGSVDFVRWSPDGQRLSFTVRNLMGFVSIWLSSSDGRDPHPLSFDRPAPFSWGQGECCADWSPDGKYLMFHSAHEGVESLWIMRQKPEWFQRGRNLPVQLYTSPDRLSEPRFSADGSKIFFVHSQENRELVRYDSTRKLFVPYLGGISARHLSFSRDGQWVAYKNQHDNTLWRSRVDGSQALQLTFPPLDTYHPTWSADGKNIAFEGGGRLYVIPSDGGKAELLLPESTLASQPSWSPDGKTIAFTQWTGPKLGGTALLDLNSRQLTVLPGSEDFEGSQWSPDGKYIAAGDKKNQKLMLWDFNRRQWSELADGLPYGWGLRWSSDSQYVYYQHAFAGEEQPIFRVRVSDHKIEQITSARQILRADVLSYTMTGLTPDNSPLASLVHRNSDVYALELDLP